MRSKREIYAGLPGGKNRIIFGLIVAMFSVFTTTIVHAQNAGKLKVTGKVVDVQNGSPLAYASIRLFKTADSAFVSGAITDETGTFLIDIEAGSYYSLTEFIGYKSQKNVGDNSCTIQFAFENRRSEIDGFRKNIG